MCWTSLATSGWPTQNRTNCWRPEADGPAVAAGAVLDLAAGPGLQVRGAGRDRLGVVPEVALVDRIQGVAPDPEVLIDGGQAGGSVADEAVAEGEEEEATVGQGSSRIDSTTDLRVVGVGVVTGSTVADEVEVVTVTVDSDLEEAAEMVDASTIDGLIDCPGVVRLVPDQGRVGVQMAVVRGVRCAPRVLDHRKCSSIGGGAIGTGRGDRSLGKGEESAGILRRRGSREEVAEEGEGEEDGHHRVPRRG